MFVFLLGRGAPAVVDWSGMEQLLPLVLFVVFYFLLIRPQQEKAKDITEMLLGNLRRGDRIVTNGGIIGTITRYYETELIVEVADGIKVRVLRGMIASLNKSEPAYLLNPKKDQTEDAQDYDEAEDEYDEDENVDIEQDKRLILPHPSQPKRQEHTLNGLLRQMGKSDTEDPAAS